MAKSIISAAELKKIPELPDDLQIGKFLELDQAYKVYKKVYYLRNGVRSHVVATLVLPEGTVIFTGKKDFNLFSGTVRPVTKMRADQAMVFPDKFSRAYITCNGGIHFYRTFERARTY